MRLGLESSSPSQAQPLSEETAPSTVLSNFIPIEVDGDSSDEEESSSLATREQFALASAVGSGTKRRLPTALGLQLDQREFKNDTDVSTSSVTQLKAFSTRPRNFFRNGTDPAMATEQPRNVSCHTVSAHSSPLSDQLHEVISAARTSICGQTFDRCELEFTPHCVKLTIWKNDTAQWQGTIKYAHMERFCFSRVKRPPYMLLLKLNSSTSRTEFATFYDPILAKVCARDEIKEQASPQMYGVIFYFDEVLEYMRCQSMGDNNPRLAHLFRDQLSEKEVQRYARSDTSRRCIDSASAASRGMVSLVGGRARHALDSVTSFFRPTSRPLVVEQHDTHSVDPTSGISLWNRTGNCTRGGLEDMVADASECNVPMLCHAAATGSPHDQTQRTNNVLFAPVDFKPINGRAVVRGKYVDAAIVQQECKVADRAESRHSAVMEEQVKRRRLASRRNEVLVTYPFDGSDTSRIAITLGDVDRLVPGEFLNDNIIDFYLRFLWRHVPSWQQQQLYFFSSHFFTQLHGTNGAQELSEVDSTVRFARVARWTQKETNLFDKRFLFIPINDSFHWSIAVFCNPGSAIIKEHRRGSRRRVSGTAHHLNPTEVVDLIDSEVGNGASDGACASAQKDKDMIENFIEVELQAYHDQRLANPPCLLFLDSLRCHRKEKFANMLRHYLECEWKARYACRSGNGSGRDDDNEVGTNESIVTVFDSDRINFLEPNIPLQSNSSDCGVFLLMYAASIVHNHPGGVTREDLANNLSSTFTSSMFQGEHVQEFREYLQQLLFCLQFLQKHGMSENQVKEEGLESFSID